MSPKAKKILRISMKSLLWLFAILLLAVITSPLWVGPLAASIARSVVPDKTGCEFKVESISLNPFSGKFELIGAHLVNPPGYKAEDAFSVATVRVDVAVGSLFSDTIHVRDITIDDPFVSYVFDDAGTNNFERIAAHASAGAEEAAPEEEKKEEGEASSKKVVIDRLAINGTKVQYRAVTIPIPLPTITDIGKESNGASFSEAADAVWKKVQEGMGPLANGIGALGDGAKSLGDSATKALGGLGDSAKGAASDATKALGDGAKALGDGATDAVKKLGGLFGK